MKEMERDRGAEGAPGFMELFTVQRICSKGGRCIVAGITDGAAVHQLVRASRGSIQVIPEVAAAYPQ